MDIQETVSIDNSNEKTIDECKSVDNLEFFDMPVSRVNAIAYVLLHRIYASDEESTQEERRVFVEFMDRFIHQTTFSGSADDYHNFAVDLARQDEYSLACDVLDIGLKQGCFAKNSDLLADYLQYGVNCGRIKEAKMHFVELMNIPRRKWTWRGFSFGIGFLLHLDQQDEFDEMIISSLSSIDCSSINYSGITNEEKCMLALVNEFRTLHPSIEEPFQVEAQIYMFLRDEDKALSSLEECESAIHNCPKCSLRRADMLFERGDYSEACKSIDRALQGAIQTQSSVNEGYIHYLYGLCFVANARKHDSGYDKETAEVIFSHFDSALEEFGDSRQNYRDIIKRNTRDVQKASHIDVSDEFNNLQALLDE